AFDELAEVYADPETAEQYVSDFGDWRGGGGDEMYLTLRRESRRAAAPDGLFILTVNVENEKLSEHYSEEVTRSRERAGEPG
ncbi:MAG TPA: hypothetical protein VF621_02865, partial [Pyrinomonadaceae bacterium]